MGSSATAPIRTPWRRVRFGSSDGSRGAIATSCGRLSPRGTQPSATLTCHRYPSGSATSGQFGGRDGERDYSACVIALDQLPKVGAPAVRALTTAGYTCLQDLAGVSRSHLANLHGVGPKAIEIIQAALEEYNLTLS